MIITILPVLLLLLLLPPGTNVATSTAVQYKILLLVFDYYVLLRRRRSDRVDRVRASSSRCTVHGQGYPVRTPSTITDHTIIIISHSLPSTTFHRCYNSVYTCTNFVFIFRVRLDKPNNNTKYNTYINVFCLEYGFDRRSGVTMVGRGNVPCTLPLLAISSYLYSIRLLD